MSLLLSVTFSCGLVIAVAHVLNRQFVAPVYDVAANLIAFACAVAASLLLAHWTPAALSTIAIVCWLVLARRTFRARRGAVAVPSRERSKLSVSVLQGSDRQRDLGTSAYAPEPEDEWDAARLSP